MDIIKRKFLSKKEKLVVMSNFSFFPSDFQKSLWSELHRVNPFPDDTNLTLSKLKVFADDKINVTQMIISVFDREENIVGKGENTGYQHFLLFPQCFETASFPDTSKGVIVWEWVKIKNPSSLCYKLKRFHYAMKIVFGRVESTVEKEKMMVTSTFTFSHSVLFIYFYPKRHIQQL